jgi:hypothetical protein
MTKGIATQRTPSRPRKNAGVGELEGAGGR